MIGFFDRKELMLVLSQKQLYEIQSALDHAGISYHTKFMQPVGRIGGRLRGNPFQQSDAAVEYKILVHRNDYDRAVSAIQPALRKR